jgi:hypothetical protein
LYIRLNFSAPHLEEIREGIDRLAGALRESISEQRRTPSVPMRPLV